MSLRAYRPFDLFRPGVPTVFDPLSLSPALWYDATDASTLTVGAGYVTQWRDKSGNGRHASSPSSGDSPLYQANGIAGKPSVNPWSYGQLLASTPVMANASIFLVGRMAAAMTGWAGAFCSGFLNSSDESGGVCYGLLHYGSNPKRIGFSGFSAATDGFQSADLGTNNWIFTGYSAGAEKYGFVNGVLSGGAPRVNSPIVNAGTQVRIGKGRTDAERWNGLISEILVLPYSITSTQRGLIERYLSAKYSIAVV